MTIITTAIADVLIIEPKVFGDDRGFFYESFNRRQWIESTGVEQPFVQDNHSFSTRGVLRGLHYQIEQAQGKLVRCVVGEVFDVAVDLREKSPSFGKWVGVHLSAENRRQLWVPEGFAHGFLALSAVAELLYKTTNYYAPEYERCIAWNDTDLDIQWPIDVEPVLATKDQNGARFNGADVFNY